MVAWVTGAPIALGGGSSIISRSWGSWVPPKQPGTIASKMAFDDRSSILCVHVPFGAYLNHVKQIILIASGLASSSGSHFLKFLQWLPDKSVWGSSPWKQRGGTCSSERKFKVS